MSLAKATALCNSRNSDTSKSISYSHTQVIKTNVRARAHLVNVVVRDLVGYAHPGRKSASNSARVDIELKFNFKKFILAF